MISLLQTIKGTTVKIVRKISEAYLGLCRIAIAELFYENSKRLKDINFFCKKSFITDVWQDPKYTSEDFFFFWTHKDTTTNENARCLPILILNFNFIQHHLHLTVWTPHPKRLFLLERMCLNNQHSKYYWISELTTNLTKTLAGRF